MPNYYDIAYQRALAKSFPGAPNRITVWRKALIKLLFYEFRNMTEQEMRAICEEVESCLYLEQHGVEAAQAHYGTTR